MNLFKAVLDTRNHNGVIGKITQFDTAALEFQIVTDGQINEAWESPTFELIAMKRDEKPVRETEQDRFTILSKEEHKVRIELKEQFLACRGSVKMQLIVKDGDRLSTSVFYIMVGESLDHGIVESHRDVAVLDELEQYVKTGYDALAYQEQRMKDVEKATHELNELMKENELQRQEAESERQSLFEENEIQRQGAFSQQLTSQRHAFDNSQSEREGAFDDLKRSMSSNFTVAQNEREYEFDNMMSSNQSRFDSAMSSNQTQFNGAESSRANIFSNSQIENERVFTANENARQTLFNTNEAARKTNETTRVANENTRKTNESSRVTAEAERQKKMSEFEAKAMQLSDELDAQVARVDAFVSANEEKLLGDRDKVDYMGNTYDTLNDRLVKSEQKLDETNAQLSNIYNNINDRISQNKQFNFTFGTSTWFSNHSDGGKEKLEKMLTYFDTTIQCLRIQYDAAQGSFISPSSENIADQIQAYNEYINNGGKTFGIKFHQSGEKMKYLFDTYGSKKICEEYSKYVINFINTLPYKSHIKNVWIMNEAGVDAFGTSYEVDVINAINLVKAEGYKVSTPYANAYAITDSSQKIVMANDFISLNCYPITDYFGKRSNIRDVADRFDKEFSIVERYLNKKDLYITEFGCSSSWKSFSYPPSYYQDGESRPIALFVEGFFQSRFMGNVKGAWYWYHHDAMTYASDTLLSVKYDTEVRYG